MKKSSRIFLAIISITFTLLLNFSIGSLPPLGKFFSPYTGLWQNLVENNENENSTKLNLPGLISEVEVMIDEMGVPHIFAQNDHDLYYAQGYFTAKDRLWQMEFQTHFAAGRISEIVGEKGLESDKYQRRMGSVYGAENAMKGMASNQKNRDVLQAYSDGVNAFIQSLDPKDYPIEYKLLDYAPEEWSPIKTAFFLKNMTFVLASGSNDLYMTNILRKYGKEITDDLFPNYPFLESPIIPEGTPLDFNPVPIPPAAKEFVGQGSNYHLKESDPSIGSNNWAVSGSKTLSGMPILSNDPHLTLSLPSIWYQMQLVAPGINVYGVTMPGAPNVIEGFNQDIAWGVTNVGSDVLDWYEIKFKDASLKEYWHDNQWKKTSIRIEKIKIKNGTTVQDTVIYTHHGPVVYLEKDEPFHQNIPVGHALKWIAHEESDEMVFFYNINRAKNYEDYREALTHISSPAQNFAYADNQGNIALWVNGKFPLKYREQGKFTLDGSDPMADWQGYIPKEHNPHVLNPPRGFISSANQFSVDPSYPYYLDFEFAPSTRGRRINERLAEMEKITIDSLRNLQMDNSNLYAKEILPTLLEFVTASSSEEKKAVEIIKKWNYWNGAYEIAPTIFENWLDNIEFLIWEDDFPKTGKSPMRYPSTDRTIYMLKNQPDMSWYDNNSTKQIENRVYIIQNAFRKTLKELKEKYGEIGESWAWYHEKGTSVKHLLPGLDAFSKLDIPIGGGAGIVNATTNRTGPSWRIVVELSDSGNPKAYGLYPGGQSGNPGSPHYDDLIQPWTNGELYPLLYLKNSKEKNSRIDYHITLQNENKNER